MKKTYLLAIIVFSIGAIMLFGSSYSLILGNLVSKETYGFDVANFDVQFLDNKKISISGVPESDEDGLKNSKEFSFTVSNNSTHDVNYRIDIIENNSINMSDVIHYVYQINDEEYSEVLSLKDNYTVKQNKVLKVNEVDTYKIKMWLSLEADESVMNKEFLANISLVATQNDYKYATTVIEKLAKTNQDSVKLVGNDYRYSSKTAQNYLWFNCKNGFTKGDDYCDKWRIIGSFNNIGENKKDAYPMLKIVNTKIIDEISFNNQELPGDYDNSYAETFANGYYYDKLSDSAKKYIMKAKWNIGNSKMKNFNSSLLEEKSKVSFNNIGLLNVSDYLYLQEDAFFPNDNVLLLNKNNNLVNVLDNTLITGNSNNSYNFLPCVYLRPDVSIISGDGSIINPYELAIKYAMNY